MSKVHICKAFLACLLLLAGALVAQQASLNGRVCDAANGQGIPSLTVRLEPPKAQGGREIVTYTDSDGRFQLRGLSAGRYLLTVSQGATPLDREVVDVNGETTREVRLRRG